jgi:hypothetical protein
MVADKHSGIKSEQVGRNRIGYARRSDLPNGDLFLFSFEIPVQFGFECGQSVA